MRLAGRATVVGLAVAVVAGMTMAGTAAADEPAAPAPAGAVIPLPVSTTPADGTFTLAPSAHLVAVGGTNASAIATDLAVILRPATGFALPVVTTAAVPGDITVQLGNPGTLAADTLGEGYDLTVAQSGVQLVAPTAHGLFNGIQTIRQLLPAWVESPVAVPGPWGIPAQHVIDYPRYGYRGVQLDIARHYESPAQVEKYIDQLSAYKIDILHLHLSDDQGFRLVINGFPDLTAIGGLTSRGTDGRSADPGGFWTQADYKAVMTYATAHFVTVVPEVDSPGHMRGLINSEVNDTTNPLLNGHPQDINCNGALCPDSDNTWTILTAVINQIAALTPGPYYDMGGDEVSANQLSGDQYNAFLEREAQIVVAAGKIPFGWADISSANLPAGSTAEYWNQSGGTSSSASTFRVSANKGMPIVMAPASVAYLDQIYVQTGSGTSRVRSPASPFGQTWAVNGGIEVDKFFNWDPETFVQPAASQPITATPNIIGVEAPVWTETLRNLAEVDYMTFPRMPATAEVGWSPAPSAGRTGGVTGAAYVDFSTRLAAQAVRWSLQSIDFYPSSEVPWVISAKSQKVGVDGTGKVVTPLASVVAPGIVLSGLSATIDWGDGSTSAGTFTRQWTPLAIDVPTGASLPTATGLYRLAGDHTYAAPGSFTGSATISAAGQAPVTVPFDVEVAGAGSETITTSVTGGQLSLTVPSSTPVALPGVTLNGQDQIITGSLNPVTVVDPRGTSAGWSLTGQVSDFAGDPSGTIPAADLGWTPTASVVPGAISDLVHAGPVTTAVTAGGALNPGSGLSTAHSLCSSVPGASTGSFTCGGTLRLGVPFDTPIGGYTAVLTITLT